MGLRVNIWENAPLSKSKAVPALHTNAASAPSPADNATGAARGAPTPTNTLHTPTTEQEEKVSAIPAGSTVVPAVEVGIVNQQLVCLGDPSLEDQWLEVQTQGGDEFVMPELRLDASRVPLEAVLLVRPRFRTSNIKQVLADTFVLVLLGRSNQCEYFARC